ncbi:hypothetical protein [Geotalea sp. SG265]|uniref:hypothetical protein n=1 Tax=Geotalea sp. SG265 TaxID=2922867 RepID=UPI001FB00DE0|nr:hypothetical protein [Geotalea sp. SG265]
MQDVSLELLRAGAYSDFLRDEINNLPSNELGRFIMTKEQVAAFGWMLTDIGCAIHCVVKEVENEEGK